MSSKKKQGEVWLADVLFKGTQQTKQRPVVIVGNELALDIDVIIAPVTDQEINLSPICQSLKVLGRSRIIKTVSCTYFQNYFHSRYRIETLFGKIT